MFLFHAPLACLPCCLVRFIWCGGGVLCVWCNVIGCGPYVAGVLYICLGAHLYGLCYYVGGATGCRFSLVHVPSAFWLKVQVGLLRSRKPFFRSSINLCAATSPFSIPVFLLARLCYSSCCFVSNLRKASNESTPICFFLRRCKV